MFLAAKEEHLEISGKKRTSLVLLSPVMTAKFKHTKL